MSSLDKRTIQTYLRHGLGQLILDTSLVVIGQGVAPLDQETVSVQVSDVLLGDEDDLDDDRIIVSTAVDDPQAKEVYGIHLQRASPNELFILFLRKEGPNFALASVSNPQGILQGCFRVQSEGNLATFVEAMRLLDQYLLPEGSSMAEEYPVEPSLPGCQDCLFLLEAGGQTDDAEESYGCGRIWAPPSLSGWLSRDEMEQHGEESGLARLPCWTSPP